MSLGNDWISVAIQECEADRKHECVSFIYVVFSWFNYNFDLYIDICIFIKSKCLIMHYSLYRN